MSTTDVVLNNLSDDSQIKEYLRNELLPKVFHDIPTNSLNVGALSLMNEYMSQTIEQQAFTNAFFFNEFFITKAVMPDSIYAHAAIFDLGYDFATPSCCQFLFELKLNDIWNNATYNANTGLYELTIDRDTKFNLSNGSVYSLDYDILIQYKTKETASSTAVEPQWNIQYINMEGNCMAVNKNPYIGYRVTDNWLCLFITASEYTRTEYTVVNNTSRSIPNNDKIIKVSTHLCGVDVTYVDKNDEEHILPQDHIMTIHSTVKDSDPYVHYIMNDPYTMRFMFQLNGTTKFVADTNSSFKFTVYTCHGKESNFTSYDNELEQPKIITSTKRYANNANILKAAFVIGPSEGGTDIGTTETLRIKTQEAYNTANVISSDNDINKWFNTFFFKNVLYPFFFKRRDDPWGRVWAGFIALKDSDDYIFRTNTLTGNIPYNVLYSNNDNIVTNNEIIIPPGWVWIYSGEDNQYTVSPYIKNTDTNIIEKASTALTVTNNDFVFSNPFGIRIQKYPFAMAYFNPWINEYVTITKIPEILINSTQADQRDASDLTTIYHATPTVTKVTRTYKNNYYKFKTLISPTKNKYIDGTELAKYLLSTAKTPTFSLNFWTYFKEPAEYDMYNEKVPVMKLTEGNYGGQLKFDPENTYMCVRTKEKIDDTSYWKLSNYWIDDVSSGESKTVSIPITNLDSTEYVFGDDSVWGNADICEQVLINDSKDVSILPATTSNPYIIFIKPDDGASYYTLKIRDTVTDTSNAIVTSITTSFRPIEQTQSTRYGESKLYQISMNVSETVINIKFNTSDDATPYKILNAKEVYIPYTQEPVEENGMYTFDFTNAGPGNVLLYAEMMYAANGTNVDYHRIKFSDLPESTPVFYVKNNSLPVADNNLRVILSASVNDEETGYVEMYPTERQSDGSYTFETIAKPINEMIDVDNFIYIASTDVNGGQWIPRTAGKSVSIDSTDPQFKISILVRSAHDDYPTPIEDNDSYKGFRLVDQYSIDSFSLVQELKEMRSVVRFGTHGFPTQDQYTLYHKFIAFNEKNSNLQIVLKYIDEKKSGSTETTITETQFISYAGTCYTDFLALVTSYETIVGTRTDYFTSLLNVLGLFGNIITGTWPDYTTAYALIIQYNVQVNTAFESTNINGGLNIQLLPFVEETLMMSDRFESFVSAFTTIHKSLEPVIMKRLEGNNYLDCKLIATYGKPHSYSSDIDKDIENAYWPDLSVQIEFDVKLYNKALESVTISELRSVTKSYFTRLTSVHTAIDNISLENNIYISKLIHELEENDNVAFLKFKGWYTDDNGPSGKYMDANTQAIVMKHDEFDDFSTKEMETFVPELFVLDENKIVFNVL